MKPLRSTTERGYGAPHRAIRARVKPLVDSGQAICTRCGRSITPGTPWDLDHAEDRTSYLGPAHRTCNRTAGARKGAQRRWGTRKRTQEPTTRPW